MDDKPEKNVAPKTLNLTPNSLSKTPVSSSYYFPGCRKDANCKCDICLASIHATRDLISRPRLSSKKQSRPFISFNSSASPRSGSKSGCTVTAPATPPALKSTAKTRPVNKGIKQKEKRERFGISGYRVLGLIVLWLVVWAVDSGMLMKVFGPKLKGEDVVRIGEQTRRIGGNLNQKIRSLQNGIERLVGEKVLDCGTHDSVWEFNQGGQEFFHWRCTVYRSNGEEVSIWGSPLKTSGLFSTGFSTRSLTLLSGRITEWSHGKIIPQMRVSNSSSWNYDKWTDSAIQLNPNTWILEYKRNGLFQGPRFIPAICDFARLNLSNFAKRLRKDPWRLLVFHRVKEEKFVRPT